MNRPRVEGLIRDLLAELGAPVGSAALSRTPGRVASSLELFTTGTRTAPGPSATLMALPNGLSLARELELISVCEHHLLPFFGRCHIATLAPTRRINLEELGQIVDRHAAGLQLQERLTDAIAREVSERVQPEGLAVAIEARHLCMMMRGVGKQGSTVSTSSLLGAFRESPASRAEFFALIGAGDRR